MSKHFYRIIASAKQAGGIGSPFPGTLQTLLLKAAVCEGDTALQSWKEWRRSFDLGDPLDAGSYRTLPLLYRNLSRLLPDEPLLPKLKAAYRQSWYRNQQLIHRALPVLQRFEREGIQTMLLKGAALGEVWYQDPGIRYMADIDLLVTPEQARDAIALLLNDGWLAEDPQGMEYNLRYGRAAAFRDSSGWELDLHWQAFFEGLRRSEIDLWQNASRVDFHGLTLSVPAKGVMLTHLIVHGMRWNPDPPIRWIPDSIEVIRGMDDTDWQVVLELAGAYRLRLTLGYALKFLKEDFNIHIPGPLLQELAALKPGFTERYLFREHMRTEAERLPEAFWPRLRYLFGVYLRQSGRSGLLPNLIGFPGFLAYRTRGKSRTRIMAWYLKRLNNRSQPSFQTNQGENYG